jgi:hypothetical protein
MLKKLIPLAAIPLLLMACVPKEKKAPETDTDTATEFIRDILDNNLDEAEKYVLKDTANTQYFEIIKQQYRKKDKAELDKYKASDIIINEISNPADSIRVIDYSNSYNKAVKNKVKLVRINGKWLVDLKYSF